jgi:four helix bundle protein
MEKILSFKQLKIWQKGIEIVEDVYKLTQEFPKEEQYGLISQMRRAAVSIPSNIAEGFKRRHSKEYKQFLHIAFGSVAELETEMIIAEKLGFLSKEAAVALSEKIDHWSRMTTVLLSRLK